jgi:TetR/AcrR family transcriptional regulator
MSYIAERRLEEKERRRAEIVDAAEAAGREMGLDALTMDDVARRARLSRALLYVYFQDRSDLMFGLAERAMSMLLNRFVEAAERNRTGLEQVSAIGRAYVAFSQEFPTLFDALARCELETPDPTQASPAEQACMLGGDKLQGVLVNSIAAGVHDGSIRADIGSPLLMSVTLWGFMHGIIQLTTTKAHALAHHGVAAQALIDHAISMITRDLKS